MLNEFPPSLTQTEEGLSRGDGDESEDGSEIFQAFGLHPEEGSEDATTAGDTYYTRRLYNNDGDNGYKLYNNEERLYIVSENLGEGEKVPVRSNSYLFQGGDSRTPTGKAGWKNSNGTNGWKSVPPSRQNSVVPSALRREKTRKATVLPPLHKVRPASFKSILTSRTNWPNQAKPGQNGSYREPACFPIFRWCLSLLGLAMLLVVVVILGQLLSDFDLDRVPVVSEANLTLVTLPSPPSTDILPTD